MQSSQAQVTPVEVESKKDKSKSITKTFLFCLLKKKIVIVTAVVNYRAF